MTARKLTVGLMVLAGTAASAMADYSTGWEAPTFTGSAGGTQQFTPAGTSGPINGPDGWQYFGSGVNSNQATVVSNAANAHSGSQYLRVATASFGNATSTSRTNFIYHTDSMTSAQMAATPILSASVWVFAEGAAAARTTASSIQLYNSAFGLVGIARLQSDGVFAFFNGAGQGIGLGGGSTNAWYKLGIQADFSTGLLSIFINDIDQTSVAVGGGWSNTFTPSDFEETDLGTSRFSGGTGTTSGNAWRYDDFSLSFSAIPAPGSAALLGVGGVLAVRRRRA